MNFHNVLYNLVGRLVPAFIAFLAVPIYIKYVGEAAYALVSILISLQAIFVLLDAGFSAGYLRQITVFSVDFEFNRKRIFNLSRSIEYLFFIVSILIFSVIYLNSSYLSNDWLNMNGALIGESTISFQLIAGIVAIRFMTLVYSSGLRGLMRFDVVNLISIISSVFKVIVALLFLRYLDESVVNIFRAYLLVSIVEVLTLKYFQGKFIYSDIFDARSGFKEVLLIKKFIGGMAVVSLTSALLSQIDKVVLSKLLPIETFTHYSIAALLASIPLMISSPVAGAIYPRFIKVIKESESEISSLYHDSSILLSLFIYPIACTLWFNTESIIYIWTQSKSISANSFLIAEILIIGSTILSIMSMPYFLSLSYNDTKTPILTNTVALIVSIPSLIYLTQEYQAVGGAFVWLIINAIFLVFFVYLLHGNYLSKDKMRWYINDNLQYLVISLLIAYIFNIFLEYIESQFVIVIFLAFAVLTSMLLCYLFSPFNKLRINKCSSQS